MVAALFAFVIGYLLFRNVVFGLVGFLAILAATAEYWLGVSYKLDDKSASARCGVSLTSLNWADVQRATASAEGIKLSPLPTSGRMEAFRGVFLRYGAERERVQKAVRRWLPAHVDLMGE